MAIHIYRKKIKSISSAMENRKTRVLIAGIGGASLGTEMLKSLLLEANSYQIIGCDISPFAYGHYDNALEKSYRVDEDNYIQSLLEISRHESIDCILPGGERPLALLSQECERFKDHGIHILANNQFVTDSFSNKGKTFALLKNIGIETPVTLSPKCSEDLDPMTYPCVVKPATGTGGSDSVFLATDRAETETYIQYLKINNKLPIVQEYISSDEGEFTIGVLSNLNSEIIGSIAMKRLFHTKLSVSSKTNHGLISSGYSQGLIDNFPQLCEIAEKIAIGVQSQGPINIQGRVRNGMLIPFEINPRFSASTYLRALAGFNEIHYYIQNVLGRVLPKPILSKPGYYLRSLNEQYIPAENILS
jgi:carbamoyl-phosphate synthase large subunit